MPGGRAGHSPGKLKAVARAWAAARGGARELADDITTRTAILPAWMRARQERAQADVVDIRASDVETVSLFFALDTQWRWHPVMASRLGLDYPAIAPTAALLGIAMTPAVMADLRAMEDAALTSFAAAHKAARAKP